MGEYDRAVGRHGLAEPNAVYSCDQPQKRLSPLFQRTLTKIVAIKAEEVESDQCGKLGAGLGA